MGDQSPNHLTILNTIVPAVLGLTAAAILAVSACFCARQVRRRNKKTNGNDASVPFQPPRRPTAVRSPSGQPPHYLKKSPSPTAIKPLPGSVGMSLTPQDGTQTNSKFIEENEMISKMQHMNGNNNNNNNNNKLHQDSKTPEIQSPGGGSGGCHDNDDVIVTGGQSEYGKLGTIVFKLRYLTDRNALVVSVVRCRGLPGKTITIGGLSANNNGTISNNNNNGPIAIGAGNNGGACCGPNDLPGPGLNNNNNNGKTQGATDPYVKLQLLPEKQHKVKTRVVRNTRNPVYDEDFTFYGLTLIELSIMSLHFVVLSFDRYSRDDVIGEVVCPLSDIDLSQIENQQIALSKEIQPRSLKIRAQGRGELLLSLCWQPAAARLTVVLLKARNLPRMDVTGLADPYVKIYLLFNGQRISKKKTHVKKRTLSPVFNESFAFDIPTSEGNVATLDGVSLELMLLDWDRVTKNEIIGRLELGGPRCTGSALVHWNEVCNSPRRQIADWHKLNE